MLPRLLLTLLLISGLSLPGLAQGNVAEAKRLAENLASRQELPTNVRLRYELLKDMMGGIASKGDSQGALTFFSTTRVLTWNRPLSAETGQTMRELEQQVVALARGAGFNLDLPPVGYSTAGAAGGAVPSTTPASSGDSMLAVRSTREGLLEFTLRAEEAGTTALSTQPSPEIQAVRDSLTVLRQDLSDSQVASDAVRNVLLTRATLLASPASAGLDPLFLERLNAATEALRSNFSPQLLRQARGQMLNL
jgi:hypothetical protein